jgi:integrase
MASIRKRGDKWQAQVRRQGMVPTTRTFTLREDARRWARQIEADADRQGLIFDRRELKRLTFGSLIERYLATVVPTKRGREIETVILRAFLRKGLAQTSVADLRPEMFSAYRKDRLKVVKPATLRRELSILHHLFEIACRDWGLPIPTNPLHGCSKGLEGRARARRIADKGESGRLTSAAANCRNGLIKPLMEFAMATGMRRSEILRAKWVDIDREKRTLHIPETKNGHPRTIPLSSEALGIIDGLTPRSDRLFPISANAVRLAWQRLVKRANVEDLHFHDLRHEAISRFFEMGLSVPEVALISGHRDIRMLFRYTHLRAEEVAIKLNSVRVGS